MGGAMHRSIQPGILDQLVQKKNFSAIMSPSLYEYEGKSELTGHTHATTIVELYYTCNCYVLLIVLVAVLNVADIIQ